MEVTNEDFEAALAEWKPFIHNVGHSLSNLPWWPGEMEHMAVLGLWDAVSHYGLNPNRSVVATCVRHRVIREALNLYLLWDPNYPGKHGQEPPQAILNSPVDAATATGDALEVIDYIADPDADATVDVEYQILLRMCWEALKPKPQAWRDRRLTVWYNHFVLGASLDDVSDAVGIAKTNVTKAYLRANQELRAIAEGWVA